MNFPTVTDTVFTREWWSHKMLETLSGNAEALWVALGIRINREWLFIAEGHRVKGKWMKCVNESLEWGEQRKLTGSIFFPIDNPEWGRWVALSREKIFLWNGENLLLGFFPEKNRVGFWGAKWGERPKEIANRCSETGAARMGDHKNSWCWFIWGKGSRVLNGIELTSNSWSSCLYLWRVKVTGIGQHSWLGRVRG